MTTPKVRQAPSGPFIPGAAVFIASSATSQGGSAVPTPTLGPVATPIVVAMPADSSNNLVNFTGTATFKSTAVAAVDVTYELIINGSPHSVGIVTVPAGGYVCAPILADTGAAAGTTITATLSAGATAANVTLNYYNLDYSVFGIS